MNTAETITTSDRLAYTGTEAAKMIGVSKRTLYRLISRGKIKVTSYGVIPRTELDRHLRAEIRT